MSPSVLPWKWVIEYLADVPDVGTSILSALVDRFPGVLLDVSGSVRERLSLRYLEEFSGMACGETPPAVVSNAPSTSASAAKIDAAKTCEEVLLSKVAAANDSGKGKAGFDGDDIHQFILLKRATLPKTNIDLLKDKILGSYHSDFLYSKQCIGLPKVSRPGHVNHLTFNHHRDHDGIKKIIRTMKHASPWLKQLTITRKYRKLRNLANNPPSRTVGGAPQNISSTQQHFLKQKAPVDEERNQQSNVDGTCSVQLFTTEKTKTNTCEEFHGVEMQSRKDNLSGYAPAPDNIEDSLQSGQQYQKLNVLHDLEEVADGSCDDLLLLEQQSSMPQSSPAQRLCIKCSRGGQLLNCRGDGCSRSIHESCLGLFASVEENGLFYCPFCAYRNARIMYEKSKRKAQEARRNLYSFYDIGPTVNDLKRKNSSAKITTESDQVSVDHQSSEHPDLPSNQQLQNSSSAQTHNDTQNSETSNVKFVEGNNLGVTQNQQNQLNDADDIVCKIILPCRETIECHIHQDVQDTPIRLKSDSGREHERSKVIENQQPVDDHGINDTVCLPCDANTHHERNGDACVTSSRNEALRDHSQVEEIKNVHTGDTDQDKISLQASKRSPLKVEEKCGHDAKRKALASQISDKISLQASKRSPLKVEEKCGHDAKRKALASQISDIFAKRKRRDKAVNIDNYEGVVANQQTGGLSLRELRKNTHRRNQSFTLKQHPSRRTKLIWKPEEEEILEEAMHKIPKNEDGSLPWLKILEFGRRVLHESRTPIDLKDKWRNMQKKDAKKRT